jgi:hypothetical protein
MAADLTSHGRLYLDTSDLLNFADGRISPQSLQEAMSATGTLLVVSRAHVQDAIDPNAPEAQEPLCQLLESFGTILVVVKGPSDVEPLGPDRPDIVVEACTNIRELLFANSARTWLESERAWQSEMHKACVASDTILGTIDMEGSMRREANRLGWECAILMIRSGNYDEVPLLIDFMQQEMNFELTSYERDRIENAMRAAVVVIRQSGAADVDEETRERVLRTWAAAQKDGALYPGALLAQGVAWEIPRQRNRKRKRSDHVDIAHVSHIPYVDIATCDGEMIHLMRTYLAKVTGPRSPRILRSGSIPEVVKAVRRKERQAQ